MEVLGICLAQYSHCVIYCDVTVWWGHWILQHNCCTAPP